MSPTWAVPPDPKALSSHLGDLPQTAFSGVADFHTPAQLIMPRHADLASRHFPSLNELTGNERRAHGNLSVCIVSHAFEGPSQPGALATEHRRLAEMLKDAGHRTTVLFMRGRNCEIGKVEEWIGHFAERGIDFVPLPDPEVPAPSGALASAIVRSRAAYEWLKGKAFDLVHAADEKGGLYAALSAKRLGLAFENTLFVVSAAAPTLWSLTNNSRPIASLSALATIYMERKSIELADVAVSPSNHMLRWMMRHGYDLPKERCFVQTSVAAATAALQAAAPADNSAGPVEEIVLFETGDTPTGTSTFMRALDTFGDALSNVKITLLRLPAVVGPSSPRARGRINVNVVDARTLADAIAYLRGKGRATFILSFLDQSPAILAALLANRVPLVLSDLGGGHEMILESDRPAAVCECTPAGAASKIRSILKDGAIVPRPAFAATDILETWKEAHLALGKPAVRERFGGQAAHRTWNGVAPVAATGEPLVSVCVTHFNRPADLANAINSIRQQTYKTIEVVVVDDGSTLPEATAYLDQLDKQLAAEKLGRVVYQPNSYPGAARNLGIRNSSGEFILFMDDDNLAKPGEIETFLRAARFSGADILCCYSDTFRGPQLPDGGEKYSERLTHFGDALSLGLYCNGFGDSNCFVRRRVFEGLGGFTQDYGIGLEDYEFFVRAVLRGFKLMVIPEALYWYRISPVRLRDRHLDRSGENTRVLNAFLDNAPPYLYEALKFARDQARTIAPPSANRDGAFQAAASALADFIDARTIAASGHFDRDYYLQANPDVAQGQVDPLMHFVQHGAAEGRKPNPAFDTANYLSDFPDVAQQGLNALAHFIGANAAKPPFTAGIAQFLRRRFASRP